MHWLEHFFGLDNGSGPQYLFWSGVSGSFAVTLVWAFPMYWWHHNCHQRLCWRIGRHAVDGTPYRACRKHHPDIPVAHKRRGLDLHAAVQHHRARKASE